MMMAATAAIEDITTLPVETIEKAIQEPEDDFDEENQLFEEHEALHKRLGKSLYYGGSESSSADRLSLPLTELCVDHFNRVMDIEDKPAKDDLDEEDDDYEEEEEDDTEQEAKRQQERLDVQRAAQVSRETCASPTSLVMALLYLERLRGSNPGYLNTVSSADLFLVSLMVASKYLHDDGEEDEVFNEEWAASGGISRKELNRLEIEFLTSIDWRLHVTPTEFERMAETIERSVAQKQLANRHWEQITYTDMMVLSKPVRAQAVWEHFLGLTIKLTTVVVAAYAASLMSMLATCQLLDQVKLGPSAISQSVNTLYSSIIRQDDVRESASLTVTDCCDNCVVDSATSSSNADLMFLEQDGCRRCNNGSVLPEFCMNAPPSSSSPHIQSCEVLPSKGTAHFLGRRVSSSVAQYVNEFGNVLEDFGYKVRGFPIEPGNGLQTRHLPTTDGVNIRDEIHIGTSWLH